MEGRMDQMQESIVRNLEQTSTQIGVMGDQIFQINQKLQITSEEIAQKLTEALEAFWRWDKEKFAIAEVHTLPPNSTTSFMALEPPQPSSPTTNPLPPFQFGTATTFFPATNTCAPIVNHCSDPRNSIQPNIPPTQLSSTVAGPEPVIRLIAVTPTIPNTIRLPPYTTRMPSWGCNKCYGKHCSRDYPQHNNEPSYSYIYLLKFTSSQYALQPFNATASQSYHQLRSNTLQPTEFYGNFSI